MPDKKTTGNPTAIPGDDQQVPGKGATKNPLAGKGGDAFADILSSVNLDEKTVEELAPTSEEKSDAVTAQEIQPSPAVASVVNTSIKGIEDIQAYIDQKKKEKQQQPEQNNKEEALFTTDGTDLLKLPGVYAIVPHAKGDHKVVYDSAHVPADLRPDPAGREKGKPYVKGGTRIYDVCLTMKEHSTLLSPNGEPLDIWIIDSPQELTDQLTAIHRGKGGGTNLQEPIIVNNGAGTTEQALIQKEVVKEEEKEPEKVKEEQPSGSKEEQETQVDTTIETEQESPEEIIQEPSTLEEIQESEGEEIPEPEEINEPEQEDQEEYIEAESEPQVPPVIETTTSQDTALEEKKVEPDLSTYRTAGTSVEETADQVVQAEPVQEEMIQEQPKEDIFADQSGTLPEDSTSQEQPSEESTREETPIEYISAQPTGEEHMFTMPQPEEPEVILASEPIETQPPIETPEIIPSASEQPIEIAVEQPAEQPAEQDISAIDLDLLSQPVEAQEEENTAPQTSSDKKDVIVTKPASIQGIVEGAAVVVAPKPSEPQKTSRKSIIIRVVLLFVLLTAVSLIFITMFSFKDSPTTAPTDSNPSTGNEEQSGFTGDTENSQTGDQQATGSGEEANIGTGMMMTGDAASTYTRDELQAKLERQQEEARDLSYQASIVNNDTASIYAKASYLKAAQTVEKITSSNHAEITQEDILETIKKIDYYLVTARDALK